MPIRCKRLLFLDLAYLGNIVYPLSVFGIPRKCAPRSGIWQKGVGGSRGVGAAGDDDGLLKVSTPGLQASLMRDDLADGSTLQKPITY